MGTRIFIVCNVSNIASSKRPCSFINFLKNLLFTSLLVCVNTEKIQLYLVSARSCSVTEGLKSYGYEHGKIHPKQKEDTSKQQLHDKNMLFLQCEGKKKKGAVVVVSIRKLSQNTIVVIQFRRKAKLHLLLTFSRYLMLFWTYVLIL